MPEPIQSPPPAPVRHHPSIEPPAVAPTPDAWERYLALALEDVDRAVGVGSTLPSRAEGDDMLRRLVEAYRSEGRGAAVHALLSERPEVFRYVASISRHQLEEALAELWPEDNVLDRLLGRQRASQLAGVVAGHVESAVRSRIVGYGQEAVANAIGEIRALADDPAELIARLRSASPGSSDGVFAELLGVEGDAGDEARVCAKLEALVDSFRAFGDRITGMRWSPADFPVSANRALDDLGLVGPSNSLGVEAAGARDQSFRVVGAATLIADILDGAPDVARLAAGLICSAEIAAQTITQGPVILVGLAVELLLDHHVEENRRAFLAAGRRLGM